MLKTVSSGGGSSGFPITLGNTVLTASSTTTTLGNLTLNNVIINGTTENGVNFSNVNVLSGNIANVTISNSTLVNANITSVAVAFPNSFLANSTVGVGNATIALGGTSANVGNVTLANVTIQSGTASLTTVALAYNGASSSTGPIAVGGNMSGGPDTGLLSTMIGNANSYVYLFVQNTNTGTGAYSTYTLGTEDYSAYANFGINNNNYSGGPASSFGLAKASYWYSHGGDAVYGTYTANAAHFIANGASSTSDAMTINSNNTVSINAIGSLFPNSYLSNSSATIGNTVVALGSTVSSLGNVTLANATITGGSVNVTTQNHLANVSITATYGNASLPLQPLGFINYDLNGTVVKIPYYAV
jgi:hypothetical protein